MGYLLDTHVVLWALDDEKQLSTGAREIISNVDSACFVSIASFFEMAVKRKIGKLDLRKSLTEYVTEIERIGIELLPITTDHLESYELIPLYDDHRDPFDRLLTASAHHENFTIISADGKFDKYKTLVETIW